LAYRLGSGRDGIGDFYRTWHPGKEVEMEEEKKKKSDDGQIFDRIDCFILGFMAASLLAIAIMLLILEEEMSKRSFILMRSVASDLPMHEKEEEKVHG
jgi:hypothetical protein